MKQVDPVLLNDDLNKDGYIDYPEFVMSQQKVTVTTSQLEVVKFYDNEVHLFLYAFEGVNAHVFRVALTILGVQRQAEKKMDL